MSICENCKNRMEWKENGAEHASCSINYNVYIPIVRECSHFNPKPKANKDFSKRMEKGLATGKPPRKKSTRYV